ncbi:MAG: hypothetical protein OS112_09180 [Methanoregula sp.]|nr:MAG: hypothetical protein OS112_09180 [Methanoregula sp.]
MGLFPGHVTAGVVTLHAAGPQSYYLGETIALYGNNTVTGGPTYLFITGPNLPLYGAQIQSTDPRNGPVMDGNAASFQSAAGDPYSWDWDTHTINLDPGTYTIYAASDPRDQDHLSSTTYALISVVLAEPFVTASLTHSTINPGDDLFVNGTATGSPTPGVNCWVRGTNYLVLMNAGTFGSESFSCGIPTSYLSPGTYDVIVQHPMENDQFDLVKSGNNLRNLQMGGATPNVATILGPGSLKYLPWGTFRDYFKVAFDDPNIDDIYTHLSFTVAGSPPSPPISSNAAVTISAAGASPYYIGETIHLTGANTASGTTYLFITGPNLHMQGSQIQNADPRLFVVIDLDPATFQQAASGGTWSWNWDTHTYNLDPGTYTIYAESSPHDLPNIGTNNFNSTTITFDEPWVSGTLSPGSTVNPGDPLSAVGTAQGDPGPGLAFWITGENYALRATNPVNPDTSYSYPVATAGLAPGEYMIAVHHPMGNNQFDVVTSGNNVINLQLGAAGLDVFTLFGAGSLENPGIPYPLLTALNNYNKDDSYTKMQFLVLGSPPTPPAPLDPTKVNISITGGCTHYLGDTIQFTGYNTVSGTTYLFINGSNLPPNGAQIQSTDPPSNSVVNGNAGTFQSAGVAGGTWSWSWDTHSVNLDHGTYNVFAESSPNDLANIGTVNFNSVPVTLVKPGVSAALSSSSFPRNTNVSIQGTAPGSYPLGVQIWVMGPNFIMKTTRSTGIDGNFVDYLYTDLSDGQYKVIVQSPGYNNVFDIVNAGNNVKNLQLGGGTNIFTLLGAGSLKSNKAVTALKAAIYDGQNDDEYTELSFQVGVPPSPPPPPPSGGGDGGGGGSGDSDAPPAAAAAAAPAAPAAAQAAPPAAPAAPSAPAAATEAAAGTFPMGFDGMSFNAEGDNSLSLDMGAADAAGAVVTVSGESVTVYQHSSPGVLITFWGEKFTIKDRKIKGKVTRAEFATDPLLANLSIGNVSGSIRADLPALTQRVAIDNTINGIVSPAVMNQFRTIAEQNNLSMDAVAYTMDIRKVNLSTGAANVTMTIPPSWVNLHGGKDTVHIARISDETGITELVSTVYTGTDKQGNMVFRGDSPKGSSVFGMLTAKATAEKQKEEPNMTIQPMQKPAIMTDVGMFAWMLGIAEQNPIIIVIIIALISVIAYFGWWNRRIKY